MTVIGLSDPEIGLFSRPNPVRNADFFTSGPRTFLDIEKKKKFVIEVPSYLALGLGPTEAFFISFKAWGRQGVVRNFY